ncbi:MAG: thiamine-phosphate kinase [Thaumarchaeota archaeon]|nr:thiamine-phosphate kinase [Nitrososphaerota archaeon]
MQSILGKAGRVPSGYYPIGDDVALVPTRGGKLVLKVDMLVEGTDVPAGMDYRQAARKAVAMCVSDFAAKGVKPDSFMVSLGLRRGTTQAQVNQIGEGLRDAERKWGVNLVGGDTNEASELVIDCVMLGFSRRVVGRNGVKPGDILVVTGAFGNPPAGLQILEEGARAESRFRKRVVRSVTDPSPNLAVGLALGKYLTSAMDSSDGLARSLHTLARAGGVGFEVDSLPIAEGVANFAKLNGLSADELVLGGGEEYVIVGTVAPAKLAAAEKAARQAGGKLLRIGRATSKKGKMVLKSKGRWRRIEDAGWTHLD